MEVKRLFLYANLIFKIFPGFEQEANKVSFGIDRIEK